MKPEEVIRTIEGLSESRKTTMLIALYLRVILGGVFQRDMETLVEAAKTEVLPGTMDCNINLTEGK